MQAGNQGKVEVIMLQVSACPLATNHAFNHSTCPLGETLQQIYPMANNLFPPEASCRVLYLNVIQRNHSFIQSTFSTDKITSDM